MDGNIYKKKIQKFFFLDSCLSDCYQKVVGDGPHAFVRQNNPNDNKIPDHRHGNDAAISHSPECDLPHRLDELVEAVAAVRGRVGSVNGAQVGAVEQRIHLWIYPLVWRLVSS